MMLCCMGMVPKIFEGNSHKAKPLKGIVLIKHFSTKALPCDCFPQIFWGPYPYNTQHHLLYDLGQKKYCIEVGASL